MFFDESTLKIFSSRDMIRQQLITYAQDYLQLENLDFSKTSYLSYLINTLSVLTSNLIYYNSAIYREFFLVRAQQKESVLNLAAMVGYTPDQAVPAEAKVLINIPVSSFIETSSIVLHGRFDPDNEPFKFYSEGVIFACKNEVRLDVTMSRGRLLALNVYEIDKTLSKSQSTEVMSNIKWRFSSDRASIYFLVNAVQAVDIVNEFTFPNLRPYEFYDKEFKFTDQFAGATLTTVPAPESSEIQTFIDQNQAVSVTASTADKIYWSPASSLFLVNPGDYGYTYRVADEGVTLYWGNNIIGTQPGEGDECTVTITSTKGASGNVLAGSISRCDRLTQSITVNGKATSRSIEIKCINPSPAAGGQDSPTIDEIRQNAIISVSTNNRLVTEADYQNISSIVTGLPIHHAKSVLKRSDLKQNEICLYTDIVYQNSYVPTKNAVIKLDVGDVTEFDVLDLYSNTTQSKNMIIVRSGDLVEIDPGRYDSTADATVDYVSMFDIHVDVDNNTSKYVYITDMIQKEVVLNEYYLDNAFTVAIPLYAEFEVTKDPDPAADTVAIRLFINKVTTKAEYSNMGCGVEIAESGLRYDMTYTDSTTTVGGATGWYEVEMLLGDLPDGDLEFDFLLYAPLKAPESRVFSCRTTTVIKNDMSEFMMSKVKRNIWYMDGTDDTADSTSGYYGLMYDVPVIKKSYFDYLEENSWNYDFIDVVTNKVATFDVSQYKMLTDFANLKFSNTTGKLTNMNFNNATRGYANVLDPLYIPGEPGSPYGTVVTGYTCAVTNDINPFNVSPYNRTEGGFLATYIPTSSTGWIFQTLSYNDIVLYNKKNSNEELNNNVLEATKLIFNNDKLFLMEKDIPLLVDVVVYVDKSVPYTDSTLAANVKTKIMNYFYPKLGYDKPIYVSEITGAIQSIPGVLYCEVKKPEHDIFFNYNLDNFDQESLLRYAPQLVIITNDSISVTIRKQ